MGKSSGKEWFGKQLIQINNSWSTLGTYFNYLITILYIYFLYKTLIYMRKKIVAGNWKMNMDLAEGLKFAGSIDKYFKENPSEKALVILCPPFIHLAGCAEILKHGKVALGAQNCAAEASGAYTGEVSAWMVKSTGAQYVIIRSF